LDLAGKKVLVTGGAGFIGSTLVDLLLRLGSKVVVYDNFDDFYAGKEANIAHHLTDKGFTVIDGDILDFERLEAASRGVDIVFHEAAQAGVRYCNEHLEKANNVNVTGTLNVLLAAKKNHVKRLVYASSSSVYGKPVRVPMDEEHPQSPPNLYGSTKLAGEKYSLSFHETFGLPVVCLRYFSVYGPRGRPDMVVASFARSIADGRRPRIFGDGSQSRDFTYVSDVVSATAMSAMSDNAVGQVLNVGYGKDYSVNYVAKKVAEYLGTDTVPEFLPGYDGDFPRTLCSNAKALRLLGWRPNVSFDEGIRFYLDWFKSKPEPQTASSPV
jgi:UDP-glucose 4-epimerase